jgi:VWFA-related protein
MRRLSLLLLALLTLCVVKVLADPAPTVPYKVEFDPLRDVTVLEGEKDNAGKLLVRVKFAITLKGNQVENIDSEYKLRIEENDLLVKEIAVPKPAPSEELSVVTAIDTSGSMKKTGMAQAREAAETFLSKLPKKADCGLILFDHEIRDTLPPILTREPLMEKIRAVEPRGGTAYLDAASAAIQMLSRVAAGRERALVLMTDGIDLNSTKTLDQVVAEASKAGVRIYTIGIGEPGLLSKVSTALVLDHSGSMKPPADDKDETPKIQALHEAGSRFVRSMSSAGRISLIPFSSAVEVPRNFSNDKAALAARIKKLEPEGETALFDAVYTGIATLETDGTPGKRAVVAMTDGIDNSSRRRLDEVLERARAADIPLYLLGFGREGELDRETMERMANETKGKYFHAGNKKDLLEIFEKLSIALHDDGIDEATLTQLATKTGGKYYAAKNVADLKLRLLDVSKSIQYSFPPVIFPSLNQRRDGTLRKVALKLVRKTEGGSDVVVEQTESKYQTGGLIVAEMNHFVYLGLLAVLGTLIALPAVMRRSGVPPGSANRG